MGQAPTPYQHLQQAASTTATPSPTMHNQQFRQPAPSQRMQTLSPNPFPQAQQNLGMSPVEQHNRANTPQNPAFNHMGGMNYMGGGPVPQNFSQNFGGMAGVGMPQPVALSQNLQARQAEAQRMYQIRLQQQQQQLAASNMAAQQRSHSSGINTMLGSSGQNPNLATPTRPAQQSTSSSPTNQYESFIRTVATVMQKQGRQFDPQPMVCGRQVNLFQVWSFVMKAKGSKSVTSNNQWPMISSALGYPQAQFPTAAHDLKRVYELNLAPYEAAYWQHQQERWKARQAQQMAGMTGNSQMSPTRVIPPRPDVQAQQYMAQLQQRVQQPQQPSVGRTTPVQSNASMPTANGWGTPQPDARQQNVSNHRRSLSHQLEATPPQNEQPGFPAPSPRNPTHKADTDAEPSLQNGTVAAATAMTGMAVKMEHGTNYTPKIRPLLDTHGGFLVTDMGKLGAEIARLKPDVPNVEEMGVIDVRAISMSLQSGIHGEVRYALDHLVKLSHDARNHVELERCEDLIDILIDCAEEQVEALAEDAAEVSDAIDLSSYEDVIRHCRVEVESLQDVPRFGTAAYALDRSADRLVAITTILRNLSFSESNHALLSSSSVIRFLSNTTRLLGTRNMLLRSHRNTQDFMKDIITFLSNTSDKIELPSREDALSILHFLLAFAPSPPPTTMPLRFTPYNPAIHRYLPPAIDSLAKLLARDDPNRAFYKHLFTADAQPSVATNHNNPSIPTTASNTASLPPSYDLLTRAFGLAISVIPERAQRALAQAHEIRVAEARKPYLTQGMLAADILASLAPDGNVARAWLEAEDGWAPSLLRLASLLSVDRSQGQGTQGMHGVQGPVRRMDHEALGFGLVTRRALGMLKRLAEKSIGDVGVKGVGRGQRNGGDAVDGVMAHEEGAETCDGEPDAIDGLKVWDMVPKRETLLGAMLTMHIDAVALKGLCAFGGLEG